MAGLAPVVAAPSGGLDGGEGTTQKKEEKIIISIYTLF
jgi:hypothetical protein